MQNNLNTDIHDEVHWHRLIWSHGMTDTITLGRCVPDLTSAAIACSQNMPFVGEILQAIATDLKIRQVPG